MRLAWYDFSFELPDAWEASRYSTAAPTGRFEFVDRNGDLGRLSWEHSKRTPDEERILTEYHRRYLQQHDQDKASGFSGIKTRRVGQFRVGYRHAGEPCQALLHLPECRKSLLWVFPTYTEEQMNRVWAPILESFKPNSAAMRDWAAFGIACALPAGFEVEKAICRPADVWLEFQHTNMHRVDIHRWGLPRELLRDRDMETFMRKVTTNQEGRILTAEKGEFRGMESVELTTEIRGTKGMDRLFSAYWRGVGRIWHNTDEQRLYACMQAGPRKVTLLKDEELLPQ
ncbi:MAG: hypothetical protein HN919_18100 [Verrucomicrobia bacterium]|jgi:hypothetical protein|nr:hypothetical protein [Verrucomicrobiota bacterium]MBT7068214.1 hypothetical protein [Verrucomicrobiota bacterium]MBT7699039.1 hypothetical protein [Verrucomicrobiota bacterium]